MYHVKHWSMPFATPHYFFGNALKFYPETIAVRPDDSGVASNNIAFFPNRNGQLKRRANFQAVFFIGFKEKTAQTDIFNFTGVDLTTHCVLNV